MNKEKLLKFFEKIVEEEILKLCWFAPEIARFFVKAHMSSEIPKYPGLARTNIKNGEIVFYPKMIFKILEEKGIDIRSEKELRRYVQAIIIHELLHFCFFGTKNFKEFENMTEEDMLIENLAQDAVINKDLERMGFSKEVKDLNFITYEVLQEGLGIELSGDEDHLTLFRKIKDTIHLLKQKKKQCPFCKAEHILPLPPTAHSPTCPLNGCGWHPEHSEFIHFTPREALEMINGLKKAGFAPAGVEQEILAVIQDRIDWKKILRRWLSQKLGGGYMDGYPDRRFIGKNPAPPRTVSLAPDNSVAVLIDTSGSISDHELSMFVGCLKGLKKVRLIWWDAQAYDEGWVDVEKILKNKKVRVKGRGGTDPIPAFKKVVEDKKVRTIIVLTDGYWYPSPEECKRVLGRKFKNTIVLTTGAKPEGFRCIKIEN